MPTNIDAQALMQSGVAEQVAAVSPAVAEQLQVALETGGQIHIPVEEYAARIAPTEHAHALLKHLKTEPEGFTRAEAQEYMQTQSEHLRQEVEQALTEKRKDAAFTLYQRYPLKIQAKSAFSDQQFTQESIDKAKQGIQGVVDSAKQPGNHSSKAEIAPVKNWLVEAARNVGLEIANYTHAVDTSAVKHVMKNHSNIKTEKARGQIAVTEADFAMIPEIISSPDRIVFGTKNRLGKNQIVYLKALPDGSTLYLEEVRTKRKELATQSLRKYPATISAESIFSTLDPNARNDSENNLIIVDMSQSRNS